VPGGRPATGPRFHAVRRLHSYTHCEVDSHSASPPKSPSPVLLHLHFPLLHCTERCFSYCCLLSSIAASRLILFLSRDLSLADILYLAGLFLRFFLFTTLPSICDSTTRLPKPLSVLIHRPDLRFAAIHLRDGFLSEPTATLSTCASIYVRWR
jgi:hypothetical protein